MVRYTLLMFNPFAKMYFCESNFLWKNNNYIVVRHKYNDDSIHYSIADALNALNKTQLEIQF